MRFILALSLVMFGGWAHASVDLNDDAKTEAGLDDDLAAAPTPGLQTLDTDRALEAELDQTVEEEIKQLANELDTAAVKTKNSKSATAGKPVRSTKDKSL